MTPPAWDLSPRTTAIGVALAVALGGGLRLLGATTDLWLDEVWTAAAVVSFDSPLDVFTRFLHSNNHPLVSLWFYALGEDASGFALRAPSWLAGTVSIALAAVLAGRRGRLEALLAAIFVAFCFVLLHFGSEARGYALTVGFAFAAQWALDRGGHAPSPRARAAFGVCVVLGLLSQLIFLFYWAGAFVQDAWRRRREERRGLRALALTHGPPALLALAFAVLHLRQVELGGGNPTDVTWLAARTVGFTLGLPVESTWAWPYAGLAALLVGACLTLRFRRGEDAFWRDAVVIVAAPALVFGVLQPEVVAVRYFILGIAFLALASADLAAAGLRRGGVSAIAAGAAVALFLLGNASHTAAFLEHGRGGYRAAIARMAHDTPPGAPILVTSDHHFRNRVVLEHHARALPAGQRLVYRDAPDPGSPARWLVRHWPERPERVPSPIEDAAGRRWVAVESYDHAAISGFFWTLYRAAP